MALPDISGDFKYVKTKLPSTNTIGVRGWKVRDEKDLLFTLETEENAQENKISHIISFLKECCDDKGKFARLSENDMKKICLETRKQAKGDEIEYNYKCPSCGFEFTDVVNLTTAQNIKEFDGSPVVVNDKMSVTFKDLDWVKSHSLYKLYADADTKFTYYFIINSIDSITYEGQTYTEFTETEVDTFIGNLDPKSMDTLYKSFDEKSSSFTLERKFKCLKCKEEINVNFGDLLSFLVL